MKDPVPLTGSDIDGGVEVVDVFDPAGMQERGYLQFYYHSKEVPLPVRDVTNTQGAGWKTEPCIERKAENYCSDCYQTNVNSFAGQDRRYMFLYTTCRHDGIPQDGDRFISAFIEKERVLRIDGRTVVQGPMKIVPFSDACPLEEVAPRNLRGAKKLDREQTRRVMEYLDDAPNIYEECVEVVEELESVVQRPRHWEQTGSCRPAQTRVATDGGSGGCQPSGSCTD